MIRMRKPIVTNSLEGPKCYLVKIVVHAPEHSARQLALMEANTCESRHFAKCAFGLIAASLELPQSGTSCRIRAKRIGVGTRPLHLKCPRACS